MNKPKEFLNQEGKTYARYVFLAHRLTQAVPFIGKYLTGTLVSVVYSAVLKEGAIEHQRRKQIYARNKAKVSEMRDGIGVSGKRTAGEVPEMRIRNQGVSGLQGLAGSSSEGSKEKEVRQ
jgi:hypothetical protein